MSRVDYSNDTRYVDTRFLAVLSSASTSIADSFQSLSAEEQKRYGAAIQLSKESLKTVEDENKFQFVTRDLKRADFYKLFVDSKDHGKTAPGGEHLVYDVDEPGYYEAMSKAFEYVATSLMKKLDFEEIVFLHDLAVNGVVSKSKVSKKETPFGKGIGIKWGYGITFDSVTDEAKLDWIRDGLIYLESHDLFPVLKADRQLQADFDSILDAELKGTVEEQWRHVDSFENSLKSQFRFALINKCYRVQVNASRAKHYSAESLIGKLFLSLQGIPKVGKWFPETHEQKRDAMERYWYSPDLLKQVADISQFLRKGCLPRDCLR